VKSVKVLAKEKDFLLIIDNGDERKTTRNMNLNITATVGVLVKVEHRW